MEPQKHEEHEKIMILILFWKMIILPHEVTVWKLRDTEATFSPSLSYHSGSDASSSVCLC